MTISSFVGTDESVESHSHDETNSQNNEGLMMAGGDESSSAIRFVNNNASGSMQQSWEQWVPMDKKLFEAVQLVQLCMLQWIDEMLTANNVPYWLCGGTLMGAIRHGGFIPHDDDVDIECFGHDFEKIAQIPLDPPFYTGFQSENGSWNGHPIAKLKFFRDDFKVDVFQREPELLEKTHFPSRAEVFPLKLYSFHNLRFWGPGKPDEYLDRCYGKKWREEVCVWNHDFNWYHGAWHDPQKVALPLSEYNKIVAAANLQRPVAAANAMKSYQAFCREYGDDTFHEQYKMYKFQQVFRRNREAAEYRESLASRRRQTSEYPGGLQP